MDSFSTDPANEFLDLNSLPFLFKLRLNSSRLVIIELLGLPGLDTFFFSLEFYYYYL